jgi:hypothetical protein
MKYIYKIASVMLFLAVLGSSRLEAQDKEAAAIKTMVEAQNYIFKAQYAAPLAGRSRALTSDYDLAVKSLLLPILNIYRRERKTGGRS